MKPARFVAVLNDHHATGAGHRDHRADFTVAYSPEWDVWNKHNGHEKAFGSSEAFALFLEDNAPDIIKPDAAQMLNIALNFRIKADVAFSVAQRLQDGYVEFGYANLVGAESRNADGNKIKIPEQFTLSVPVFAGLDAPRYKVEARFRYRLKDGALKLWYELVRPHKVLEQAFKDVWEKIAKETKAPMLHGDPG